MQLLVFFIFLFCGLNTSSQEKPNREVTNAHATSLVENFKNESLISSVQRNVTTVEGPSRKSYKEMRNKEPRRKKNRRRRRKNKRKNIRVPRAATARVERIWKEGVIPYQFDETFVGDTALIKQAMRQWENYTCIKFVEMENDEHPDYILFTEKNCGCCSFFVGREGTGSQEISISSRCQMGNILHELGHAIGFWHEHSRPDRDQHVKILNDNIIRGLEGNFKKLNQSEIDTWNSPYDFTSIMHYGRRGFSRGQYLETIVPIDPETEKEDIGQRARLSDHDIEQANHLYKCPKCGQTFQESSGSFSFSSKSITENECEWRIMATSGEKIILSIIDFDIAAESSNCSTSYLEVTDGYWHKSPLLGKICGNGKSRSIVSTGNRMLITYHSEDPQIPQTFSIQYETICGGEIFLNGEQRIESPNYPEHYRSNRECGWKIVVNENFQVALKFQYFETEKHEHCLYDFVEVRDGFSTDSNVLGLYCGYILPPDLMSSSNHLLLRFRSDGSRQKGGFSATVFKEFDKCAKTEHGCGQKCINILGNYKCVCDIGFELQEDGKQCKGTCGGLLKTSSGTIISPSFPNAYPLNQTCVWEIIARPQHRIILNFTHFELEGENENSLYKQVCDYDKVEIETQITKDKIKKLGVFCGSKLPLPILSEGNVMTVRFTSDDTFTKTGFFAFFTVERDECADNNGGCQHKCIKTVESYHCLCPNGFTLESNQHNCSLGDCYHEVTDPFGSIESPNYPKLYPKLQNCVWKFRTKPGHRVRIAFLSFELESHQECLYDYIELHNGPSSENSTMGTFCGFKLPPVMVSSSNELYLNFKSNAAIQRRGFWATYSSICGGMLLAAPEKKYIVSHSTFGEETYYNKVSCEWSIAASDDYSIKLTFLNFNLEDSKDCDADFVEIFDGLDFNSIYYGRFCGSNKPPEIISSDEGLRIRFQSDESFGTQGFKVEYVAVDDV